MSANTPEKDRANPSTGLAIVAACLPLVFLVLACPLSIVALPRGGLTDALSEGGVMVWVVFSSAVVALVATALLLALSAKGRRIPAFFAVGFASLPWVCGLGGALLGVSQANAITGNADGALRASVIAAGIAQAANNSFFGAALSSALLSAVGLGLAIGALAQRAPERRIVGAIAGGGATLPLLGLVLFALIWLPTLSAIELVLATFGAMLTAALAGYATGADAPGGRSGSLGAAACVASGLAVTAGAALATAASTMEIFTALAFADPATRSALLDQAFSELAPFIITSSLGLPLALLPAALIAGIAALRVRPTAGRIAAAVMLVLLAAAVVGADAIVRGRANALFMAAAAG